MTAHLTQGVVDRFGPDTYQATQPLQQDISTNAGIQHDLFARTGPQQLDSPAHADCAPLVAIAGQITAITVAQGMYHIQLELELCYFAIGVSVVGNLTAIFLFPENKRLTEYENFLMVLFDLLQLAFLLYLTGGLHNPFALLLLGPVMISANVMGLRSTLIIAVRRLCW